MAHRLRLLDDARFPIVLYRIPEPGGAELQHGDDLLADLDGLLGRGAPFTLISIGQHDREPLPIRRARAAWLRLNRVRFAGRCRGLVHVAPDDDERRRMSEQLSTLGDSLGTPLSVVATLAEAETLARSLLDSEREESSMPDPTSTSDAAVAALLKTFQSKLLARDFDGLEALMTNDFTYVGPDGAALDRAALLAREKQGASSQPVTEIEHRLVSVQGGSEQAEAIVEMRFRTVIGDGPSQVIYEGSGRERVALRREGPSWRFVRVAVEGHMLTRNGEAAGAEAIDEMHRGSQA